MWTQDYVVHVSTNHEKDWIDPQKKLETDNRPWTSQAIMPLGTPVSLRPVDKDTLPLAHAQFPWIRRNFRIKLDAFTVPPLGYLPPSSEG